jgi:hypothetical protein
MINRYTVSTRKATEARPLFISQYPQGSDKSKRSQTSEFFLFLFSSFVIFCCCWGKNISWQIECLNFQHLHCPLCYCDKTVVWGIDYLFKDFCELWNGCFTWGHWYQLCDPSWSPWCVSNAVRLNLSCLISPASLIYIKCYVFMLILFDCVVNWCQYKCSKLGGRSWPCSAAFAAKKIAVSYP